ncbi:GntR family transcriptional regulator YhfZ [Paenibacillus sp. DMB20]|uniref:GntR family transcriptional regulator YhfZ n=1 Tax=Paenibacillus sp. DMB20 TaxID=1642570 RepID=UPI000627F711|nr:GntR family transcriptional regulator YhfZ [Paenibacillus sp. DMB20]KKO51199.1 hypothetical protein XI25_28925 [Paenibacillus sp. DMB20]
MQGLNSKSSIVLKKLVEDILLIELDTRIPKIEELSKKYGVGRGTIQNVLKQMEENNCVVLESRGHLGTFLRDKNMNLLLQCCGVHNIIGVMPLPYSRKYEGLATALHEGFEDIGLPLHCAFMRGAAIRLNNLIEGRYDFALVSKYAALTESSKSKDLLIVKEFGVNSYVSRHAIVLAENTGGIQDGMKIGVDSYSIDQQVLTNLEVKGKNVELVNLNYMHLFEHLKSKSIDAMIWNIDEIDSTSFHLAELTSEEALKMDKEMSRAAIVINKDNSKMEYLLNLVSAAHVMEVQKQVELGERMPKY